MKTVARFREPYQAHIARGVLESAEIDAYVLDDHLVGTNWLYSSAIGGVRLYVDDENEAAALEILNAEVEDPGEDEPCPACGSAEFEVSRYSLWSIIPALLTTAPLFFPRKSWRCTRCRARWGPDSSEGAE
jgi:hypothetical protein